MFKNMKLAGKMTLGFGLVILLVLVVGGLAILNMLDISEQSESLNNAYVPEVGVANEIERTSLETMYAMRGYAFSFDQSYYEEGMTNLEMVKQHLEDAFNLTEQYDYLEALKADAETASSYVSEYESQARETYDVISEILEHRNVMDTAAANYLQQASAYLESQRTQYNEDLATDAGQQTLQDRMQKIFLINDAIDVANNARVLNFKAQATMNTSYFQEALTKLEEVDAIGEALLSITRRQANIDQIEAIGEARHNYMTAVAETMNAYEHLNTLGEQRNATAEEVLAAALDTATKGIETTKNVSQAAVDKVSSSIVVIIIGLIVALVLAVIIAIVLTRMITRALKAGVAFAQDVAAGDLTVTLDIRQKDEIGVLADALRGMLAALQYKAQIVERIAEGDLTVEIEKASDKDGLGQSLLEMRKSLTDILSQVRMASDQVTTGADQVSQASQNLSQGATEQASSLEEISSSVNQINSQSRQNAENATEANTLAKQSAQGAEDGNNEMKKLTEAMGAINASSDEIKKVVKVIDDIAFQINLLALNANVEAARAGKYGKGFAVVAEEVRNLAVRAASAVKETTTMVEDSISNIDRGNASVESTAKQLDEIVGSIAKVANFLDEIAVASKEQAQGIEQITEGLDQIEQVTQSNTASAEESASASEELAGQAQELQMLISRFQLEGSSAETLSLPEPDEDEEEEAS